MVKGVGSSKKMIKGKGSSKKIDAGIYVTKKKANVKKYATVDFLQSCFC